MADTERVTIKQLYEQIEKLDTKLGKKIDSLESKIENNYVTRTEFEVALEPLKRLVWGVVGAVTSGLIGAIFFLITQGSS